jgi:hypothetical protein
VRLLVAVVKTSHLVVSREEPLNSSSNVQFHCPLGAVTGGVVPEQAVAACTLETEAFGADASDVTAGDGTPADGDAVVAVVAVVVVVVVDEAAVAEAAGCSTVAEGLHWPKSRTNGPQVVEPGSCARTALDAGPLTTAVNNPRISVAQSSTPAGTHTALRRPQIDSATVLPPAFGLKAEPLLPLLPGKETPWH